MTDPTGSLFALARSYDQNGKQTTHPPHEAIASQTLTARAHADHILLEGMKEGDEVLLMPSGLWPAENGALRPGVDALAAHLVDAGALVTIAPSLCVAHLECLPCSRTHSPHQLLAVPQVVPVAARRRVGLHGGPQVHCRAAPEPARGRARALRRHERCRGAARACRCHALGRQLGRRHGHDVRRARAPHPVGRRHGHDVRRARAPHPVGWQLIDGGQPRAPNGQWGQGRSR